MLTVHKYGFMPRDSDVVEIPMPPAEVLSVEWQGPQDDRGQFCLWAKVEVAGRPDQASATFTLRRFLVAGTGQDISEWRGRLSFIGTVHLRDRGLVFHIFEVHAG